MEFVIIPNKSIGEILFGLERNEIRNILTGFKGEFKKNKFCKNTTDDFGYCHVFYDGKDKCNAVEFFSPKKLIYENKNLFDLSIEELKYLFPDIREEYGSYISQKSSIGIVFEGNVVESILIGCKDYYC